MGKSAIILGLGFLLSGLSLAQNKVNIAFDKHTILLLEDMYLIKPIENTCGESLVDPNLPKGSGNINPNIRIDSIDNQSMRLQANVDFYDCNLSFFTNKGVLSLDMAFNNEASKPVRVFTPGDLIYKYKEEKKVAMATEASPMPAGPKESTDINVVMSDVRRDYMNVPVTKDYIDFIVTNIIYREQYAYIFITVSNKRSPADYVLSDIIFGQTIKSRKSKAGQEDVKYLEVIDKVIPDDNTVMAGEKVELCFQLEKFTLTKKNRLYIDFNEKDGRRKIRIEIKDNYLNKNARTL